MNLTDREKELLKGMIDRGEPLPPRYRASLLNQTFEAVPKWPGAKLDSAMVLPLRKIEGENLRNNKACLSG